MGRTRATDRDTWFVNVSSLYERQPWLTKTCANPRCAKDFLTQVKHQRWCSPRCYQTDYSRRYYWAHRDAVLARSALLRRRRGVPAIPQKGTRRGPRPEEAPG